MAWAGHGHGCHGEQSLIFLFIERGLAWYGAGSIATTNLTCVFAQDAFLSRLKSSCYVLDRLRLCFFLPVATASFARALAQTLASSVCLCAGGVEPLVHAAPTCIVGGCERVCA